MSKKDTLQNNLDALFSFAMGLVRIREDAEDLVQITAEKAMSAKKSPDNESEYRKWLFCILRNAFIDMYRKSRQLDDLGSIEDMGSHDANLVDVLTVKKGMRSLNLEYREIIYLVDITGFSYVEAAEILAIPIGTVMSRLSRARKALLAAISVAKSRVIKLERGGK